MKCIHQGGLRLPFPEISERQMNEVNFNMLTDIRSVHAIAETSPAESISSRDLQGVLDSSYIRTTHLRI